ncbi:MAG: hypothetical protein WCL61_01890 [bacterium]
MFLFNQYQDLLTEEDKKLLLAIRHFFIVAGLEMTRRYHKKQFTAQQVNLNCHIAARVVAHFFNVSVQDGWILPKYHHSWCVTETKHIIDVLPIGAYSDPILWVNNGTFDHFHKQYIPEPTEKTLVRVNGQETTSVVKLWVDCLLESDIAKEMPENHRKRMRQEFQN